MFSEKKLSTIQYIGYAVYKSGEDETVELRVSYICMMSTGKVQRRLVIHQTLGLEGGAALE